MIKMQFVGCFPCLAALHFVFFANKVRYAYRLVKLNSNEKSFIMLDNRNSILLKKKKLKKTIFYRKIITKNFKHYN